MSLWLESNELSPSGSPSRNGKAAFQMKFPLKIKKTIIKIRHYSGVSLPCACLLWPGLLILIRVVYKKLVTEHNGGCRISIWGAMVVVGGVY